MPGPSKRLRIFAGPNGSGKSTVINQIKGRYNCGPYINADDIQQSLDKYAHIDLYRNYGLRFVQEDFDKYLQSTGLSWEAKAAEQKIKVNLFPDGFSLKVKGLSGAYDAAIAADFIRRQLLQKEQTFTFETVFSHPSKIGFMSEARALGFKNYLYFVCTVAPEINISRVANRVAAGGHDVPQDKIISRYEASLKLLPGIIPLIHRGFFFDNSSEEGAQLVGEINTAGDFKTTSAYMPWWLEKYVVEPLYRP